MHSSICMRHLHSRGDDEGFNAVAVKDIGVRPLGLKYELRGHMFLENCRSKHVCPVAKTALLAIFYYYLIIFIIDVKLILNMCYNDFGDIRL